MNIKGNLRKITELFIGLTAVAIMALAGCGGGGGGDSSPASVVVSTFAGTSGLYGLIDGSGSAVRFISPNSIASDGNNLYVTDRNANNIRKIVIATGMVTTFAGDATGIPGASDAVGTSARFNAPYGITIDSIKTHLYVADSGNNNIRQIAISGAAVTTIAGSITGASGVADSPGALFNHPVGITRIGTYLFVSDSNSRTIRKININVASAVVSTLAGTAGITGYNDGQSGSAVLFAYPTDLTTDGSSLYLIDTGNHDVRKVDPTSGYTTIIAGGTASTASGAADASGTSARFKMPWGITTDGTNLYVADSGNNTIRKIVILSGAVTTLAGTAGASGVTDGTGSAALFNFPNGIIYVNGVLYIADFNNYSIRKIQL